MPIACLGSLAIAGLGLLAQPNIVEACSYSPVSPMLVNWEVPLAGPIAVDVHCRETDYCEVGVPEINVRRDGGAPVSGEVRLQHTRDKLYLVFWPHEPLVDGAGYSMTIGVPEGTRFETLRASANVVADVPKAADVPVQLYAFATPVEPWLCCNNNETCGSSFCITEHERVQAGLAPSLPETASALYRMRHLDEEGNEVVGQWARHDQGVASGFDYVADEYCATLEVLSLIDGSTSSHSVCRPSFDGLRVGELVKPPEYRVDFLSHHGCTSPPTAVGYETPAYLLDAWCEGWLPACSNRADEQFARCPALFSTLCGPVQAEPEPGDAGPGPEGAAHDAGLGPNSAAHDASATNTEGEPALEVDGPLEEKPSTGCSISLPAADRESGVLWLFAAALLLRPYVRRRLNAR